MKLTLHKEILFTNNKNLPVVCPVYLIKFNLKPVCCVNPSSSLSLRSETP